VSLAVGEEPVDDHAADGEEEDEQAPQHLVCYWAVGLDYLDCCRDASAAARKLSR
jgi:hypothetical protein